MRQSGSQFRLLARPHELAIALRQFLSQLSVTSQRLTLPCYFSVRLWKLPAHWRPAAGKFLW